MYRVSTIEIPLVTSKFHNKTLYEYVDIKLIDNLLNSTQLTHRETIQLNRYKKLVKNNIATVKYIHSTKSTFPMGRVFVERGVGLQMFSKNIRNYLTQNNYVAIDIVNAFPTILSQLCTKHNIDAPFLKYYVEHQDHVLNSIKYNNDKIKLLFLQLINCGSIHSWKTKNEIPYLPLGQFPYRFETESRVTAGKIYDKNIKLQNHKGKKSTIAKVLQFHENNILEHVYDYLCQNKFITNNNCILCFDGIMIKKNTNIDQTLLSDISDYVVGKTRFDLQFAFKNINPTKYDPNTCKTQYIDSDIE